MNRFLERSRVVAVDAIVLFRTILSNQIMPQQSSSSSQMTLKTLLLEQANVPYQNQFAIKLLYYEKEFNLLKYHGFVEYSKSKLVVSNQYRLLTNSTQPGASDQTGTDSNISNNYSIVDNSTSAVANVNVNTVDSDSKENTEDMNNTTTVTNNKENSNNNNTTKRNVAKIAFMITSSMRNELITRLQYTTNDIKTMTPLEASLILHNNIIPSDRHSTVSYYVTQYETEQKYIRIQQEEKIQRQQEQEQEEKQRQELQKEEERLLIVQQEKEEQIKKEKLLLYQKEERITEHHESTATIPAHSVIRSNDKGDDTSKQRRRLWFELVKINNNTPSPTTNTKDDNNNHDEEKHSATTPPTSTPTPSTTEVIGLYTTEKEAVFGLETHQFFAEREIKRNEISKINDKKNHRSSTTDTTSSSTPAGTSTPIFEIRESWR